MLSRVFLYISCMFFLCSCSLFQPKPTQDLDAIFQRVDGENFKLISKDIKTYAKTLKHRYELTSFPNYNNFMINIGLKKRGLCWQLAYDLLDFLKPKGYNVDYYIAGANINNYFKEHNVLVLTCKGCKFEDGVLVDLWRLGGEVYCSTLKADEKFEWSQRGGKR